jgi:hypothetical protein
MTDIPRAFPGGNPSSWDGKIANGMTLRDWFAGQALAGTWRQALHQERNSDEVIDLSSFTRRSAYWAYALADAMLAERTK